MSSRDSEDKEDRKGLLDGRPGLRASWPSAKGPFGFGNDGPVLRASWPSAGGPFGFCDDGPVLRGWSGASGVAVAVCRGTVWFL